jgi:hypothetical protein
VPFKLSNLFFGESDSSKFARNGCSQALWVTSRFAAASLCFDTVAEDRTDFLTERATVPLGTTLKECLHGGVDFANDNLSERRTSISIRRTPRARGASTIHRSRLYLKGLWLLDRPLSRAMTSNW